MSIASVAPVLRRPSTINPAPDAWAVVGTGIRGSTALRALHAVGIPAVGYDRSPDTVVTGAADVLLGHEVIALEEIEDIDALGVTSRDVKTGEISTDYFAGAIIATGK